MKKLLYPLLLVILILTAGCDFIPGGNEPPVAYIDSISPSDAAAGETVTFTGHGTDTDGTVVGYQWRSSIDGDIGSLASLDSSVLSEGNHIIYLKVQDNNNAWSEEVESVVIVGGVSAGSAEEGASETGSGTTTALPYINYLTAEPATISPGGSSLISWSVSNADTVTASYDSVIVTLPKTGSAPVRPTRTTTYTVVARSGASTVSTTVTVAVQGAAQPNTGADSEGVDDVQLFFYAPYTQYDSGESDDPSFNHLYGNALLVMDFPLVSAESGSGNSDGATGPKLIAGDSGTNKTLWTYFSFDISALAGKQIDKVVLYCPPSGQNGNPWQSLGTLNINPVAYTSQIPSSTKPSLIVVPGMPSISGAAGLSQVDVTTLLWKVTGPRFQVKLQFNTTTDHDEQPDNITWTSTSVKLRVQYH